MTTDKSATTDAEIHPLIRDRWSPRAFSAKQVTGDLVLKLLEAARWAASSFNEQPWRFLIASKQQPEEFEKALSCLAETNQNWARHASVLMLTFVKEEFSKNGKPNRCGDHDLGLAVGNLTTQATAEGLVLHQMAGILTDRIREVYDVPDGFHPATAIAVGYQGDPQSLEEDWARESEKAPRTRKPLGEIAFQGGWGRAWPAAK
ncbi:MAG: nitroreductase family protein [Bryobacterales bacterium]|nr:nitroreductase family protein [Bryobacterales bacterium]